MNRALAYQEARENEPQVRAIVKAVEKTAKEGGIDPESYPGFLLDSLELCLPHHWAAHARVAHVPPPTPEIIEAVKAEFRKRLRGL